MYPASQRDRRGPTWLATRTARAAFRTGLSHHTGPTARSRRTAIPAQQAFDHRSPSLLHVGQKTRHVPFLEPLAIAPAIVSWPSSKASDYAAINAPQIARPPGKYAYRPSVAGIIRLPELWRRS